MALFDFLLREKRTATARSDDPYLSQFFGLGGGPGGSVDPERLLSNSAVAVRCVGLRAEAMASVGLHVFRRTADGGRERASDHPLYAILHDNFNDRQTAFEGREMLIRNLDMFGNAYARIERNARGDVSALYPFPSGTVSVERLTSGRLRYRVSERGGNSILLEEEVLHLRGPSRDGIVGASPIQLARQSMGIRLAQAETAENLLSNGLRQSGVLSYPDRLTAEVKAGLRNDLKDRFKTGGSGFLVLDGGSKFEAISWSPEDAEFLDSIKLSNEDVARIFGVPPTSVGITDKATYSNTEQEGRALVQNCLGPLASRIEAALQRALLLPDERAEYYVEHDLSALLRGDVQARFEGYRIAREIGAFSPNDVRRRENEPPIPGGDVYHQPANWVPLGTVAQGGGNGQP